MKTTWNIIKTNKMTAREEAVTKHIHRSWKIIDFLASSLKGAPNKDIFTSFWKTKSEIASYASLGR